MQKKWLWALGVPVVAAGVAVLTPTKAADHIDSPGSTLDNAADIDDVFSWTPNTGRTAIAMTLSGPEVTTSTQLSNKVNYNFVIRSIINAAPPAFALDAKKFDISCTADTATPQNVTCAQASSGLTKTVVFNAVAACATTDDICMFAGERQDPFFFDVNGFKSFEATGDAAALTSPLAPHSNFFATSHVIAIVLEVNTAKFFPDSQADAAAALTDANSTNTPYITVAAETVRNP